MNKCAEDMRKGASLIVIAPCGSTLYIDPPNCYFECELPTGHKTSPHRTKLVHASESMEQDDSVYYVWWHSDTNYRLPR